MKFYIVDAFSDTLFGGNPAAVVILHKGFDFPDDDIMLKTAAELRYSETAFIKQLNETEFNIRYFTPASEVDLCGHATIASFCALADLKIIKNDSSYINITKAGRLNIDVSNNSFLMDMGLPESMGKISVLSDLRELYSIMGLHYEGQGEVSLCKKNNNILLPEIISTGLPDIMLPVKDEEELYKIKPDFPALSKLSERYKVVGVHAFTINAKDNAIHCRNFAPLYDIDEEAATGTSNGALTYYLYKNGLLQEELENLFVQGEAMNRPSKITSKLFLSEDKIKIQVGGMATILAYGEIMI